jgi:predicted metal-dependent hydrolase
MNTENGAELIVGFVADLFFSVRIEEAARRLDYRVIWVEKADDVAPVDLEAPERQWAEHLQGRGAVLFDDLSRWAPALIIFDLNNDQIPWKEWIELITSVPATRRIPVMCFGSHMDVETMRAAKEAGADVVLARSRFVKELPDLIKKYARSIDDEALRETCQQPLSQKAVEGLEEFNRGEFYEAHEYLEEAWMADESLGRNLYRGVLQVAVAYYHILQGNHNGAAKLFLRVRQWIDPLPATCRGVDVARLRAEAREVHEELLRLGPERIGEFDRSLLRPVHFVLPEGRNH